MRAGGTGPVLAACAAMCAAVVLRAQDSGSAGGRSGAETRAMEYLAREVPRWRNEHACYSCHNNGDAARVLIVGLARGHDVRRALRDTLEWLSNPERWNSNAGGEGGGDDKRLARIQFALAAVAAANAALVPQSAVDAAAELVAADQRPDGSWRLDSSASLGSPATYGTPLATAFALRVLSHARAPARPDAMARGVDWLRRVEALNAPDAVALLIGLGDAKDETSSRQRHRALDFLKRSQGPDGGWGAYPTTASEPFDTAIAVLALLERSRRPDLAAPVYNGTELETSIARGREYLVRAQLPDGSWPETTRPARQESYAQRISTTAWAALALMGESQPRQERDRVVSTPKLQTSTPPRH
ncbi:MAG TPA: prenyltransferase/squalene oxidase repeat-containing protein [Vicinamibacterales bacterium]|nr:prenyltransferase/squalene oxidase repeat-containing protein [Vicinamibacterales bacterium]